MKAMKKTMTFLLVLALCVGMLASTAYAAAVSSNGLEITLTADKEAYTSEETITTTLTVKNTNTFPVTDITMEQLLPAGYVQAPNTPATLQGITVGSGETVTMTVTLLALSSETTEPLITEIPDTGTNPATGDHSVAVLWLVLALGSGAVLVLLAVLGGQNKKLLSLVLCGILAAAAFSSVYFGAQAEQSDIQTVEVTATVAVNDIPMELHARITYPPVVMPTEPALTEPAPTEPAPTEPAPTEAEPVPTEPAPTEPEITPFGTAEGSVAKASDRTQYLCGATVELLDPNDPQSALKTLHTDTNGRFRTDLPGGTYLIRISAEGYLPFETLETVVNGEVTTLETCLLVEVAPENENGTVSGTVINAVTGANIPDATLTVREGRNVLSGAVVATGSTDSNGTYRFTLPLGIYTIQMECNGYISTHTNVAVIPEETIRNASMTPDGSGAIALGDMRIILEWTGEPRDLDAHLWGPIKDGADRYHIYYKNMAHQNNNVTYAYLDQDDVNYAGPETVTVYSMEPNGVYSFYVHDFTNAGTNRSTVLANSGANVRVYMGEELIAQYHVDNTGVGNVWHVFNFDATTGTILPVNDFSDCNRTDYVGAQ